MLHTFKTPFKELSYCRNCRIANILNIYQNKVPFAFLIGYPIHQIILNLIVIIQQ